MNAVLQWEIDDIYRKGVQIVREQILLSFVGNRDPYSGEESGPVLSLLSERRYNRVFLFCTGSEYYERAKAVEDITKEEEGASYSFIRLDLESVIDYEEIYEKLQRSVNMILNRYGHRKPEISVLLDPGTPQMQTGWFLMVLSGALDAKLLQGIPPRFAGGVYKVREVDLKETNLPGAGVSSKRINRVESISPETRIEEWIQPDLKTKIVGKSPVFLDSLEKAMKVAQYDLSVLLSGETGTGKEVFARSIHEKSKRRDKPFIPINCASVSPSLAESEFFGHKKGPFTGADQNRLGHFRTADGGTIFLDEIGDLPKEIQPKLLRVLENRTVLPVGADGEIEVDVRIIAATNRNLEELMKEGIFRSDLFERLQQFIVEIPPLRERKDDIPLLVGEFVDDWNRKYRENKGIAEETLKLILEYPWPGNVRELSNAVMTICAQGQTNAITPELLPAKILGITPPAFRKACRERFGFPTQQQRES
ncbi:MAG: sigma-54-dependent Fis family transcriptional regulator [Spirochaetales bacterium]|nr:sigma-54-dependent Fis family transcriptional regulator [Spirochaetales bacterium]